MDQRQWKNFIQLLGLGSLVFGLVSIWSHYQPYLQAVRMIDGLTGTSSTSISAFLGMADEFGYGPVDLLVRSPWVWAGVLLVVAPYLIGLATSPQRASIPATSPIELFVECRSCGGAVKEKAPFCPHCGTGR